MVDFYGKYADIFKNKRLFLFDMDGTIYQENDLFDGTIDLLDYIKQIKGRSVFITNNSSKSVKDYVVKLRNMGIQVSCEDFFTSAQATVLYLKENFSQKAVYCMGTASFVKELQQAGIQVYQQPTDKAGVILMGYDTEMTYQKLRDICYMLQQPLPFIATNPDLVCPVSFNGKPGFVPDCGSFAVGILNATGKVPKYIGKPEPTMIQIVMEKFGYTPEQTLVLGDRLYTDIAAGNRAGVDTICMLSGEASEEDICKSENKPTFVFKNVRELYSQLKK